LQVEVNRALYMDEANFEKTAGFQRIKADLDQMVRALIAGTATLSVPRAAAE
jgi:N-formylglutamate amidohydrolase